MVGSRKIHEQLPQPSEQAATDVWSRLKPSSKPRRPASAIATYQILIVDDELWAALDMEWVVRKLRHEVVGPAATAEEAIELAESARPDLVLMDIRLADDSDGVAAAVEIRQRFDIPSLFVSAHGDQTTRKRAIAARPSGFIEKPFTPEALSLAIEAALKPSEPSS
jgi:DNA-binding NarL/FixJ family response regulator